jgi:O-antigen/teichoic acid export membrane protein
MAGAVVHVIASYILHPYRPRPRLEWAKTRELFRYGKWVLGSRALEYLVHHLDDLLVGRLLGAAGLGLYRMAYNMSELATTEITHVAGQVLFPAYSKLQERRNDLRRAYLKAMHLLALLSFPIAGGFFFLARTFTQLILGAKWLPMVTALQILLVWGLVRSIGAASGALFSGMGRPDLNTKLQFVKMVFLAALIYPMTTTWGITGAAVAVLIADLPVDAVSIYLANRMVESPLRNVWQVVAYPLLNTLLMLGALHLATQALDPQAGFGPFITLIVAGALSYGAGILVCGWCLGTPLMVF